MSITWADRKDPEVMRLIRQHGKTFKVFHVCTTRETGRNGRIRFHVLLERRGEPILQPDGSLRSFRWSLFRKI
jgi:hypothetical protein